MPIEHLTSDVIARINDRFQDLESLKLSHNGLLGYLWTSCRPKIQLLGILNTNIYIYIYILAQWVRIYVILQCCLLFIQESNWLGISRRWDLWGNWTCPITVFSGWCEIICEYTYAIHVASIRLSLWLTIIHAHTQWLDSELRAVFFNNIIYSDCIMFCWIYCLSTFALSLFYQLRLAP